MQVAQLLYEGVEIDGETVGLITYMRTDGVDMAPEPSARRGVSSSANTARSTCPHGAAPLHHPRPRTRRKPRGDPPHRSRPPAAHVARRLDPEQARLYELIWIRTIASQMESALLERTTVDIDAAVAPGAAYRTVNLRATGRSCSSTASHPVSGRSRRRGGRGQRRRSRRCARAMRSSARISSRPSTSPSRRRATPRPVWSSAWRNSASGGRRPMPPCSRPCAIASMW